jgi:23S rRNA pseudouridine2605 synthase
MTAKKNTKSPAPAAKSASKAKKTDAASKKPAAMSKATAAKAAKPAVKSPVPAKKGTAPAKKVPANTKASAARSRKRTAKSELEGASSIGAPVLDPIGDETNGEGQTHLGNERESTAQAKSEMEAFRSDSMDAASDAIVEAGPGAEAAEARARSKAVDAVADGEEDRPEAEADAEAREPAKRGPAKLERLQKILSAAGVASRRSAEEMIVAGRVIVNGQVVTQLGSKADASRDHIRVDGKLLHGAERHRYFMLNKPRGYVTTVSDPEGRPTVMEFFQNARERVYPVGRLDYLSEGLLLMTNDGELANLLSKAGSGVEKTYLVKVAGQPSAEELERLRGGVTIEKGEPGSARVRTAPARIREFREGDNPWFEVVLIEGRNRELRKMFAAIGHFAEKIRRVGYGPLVLDVEPGKLRELDEDEVKALRLTAEGKMKPRRAKTEKLLPKEAGVSADKRAEKRGSRAGKDFSRRPAPRPGSGFARPQGRPFRSDRPMQRPGGATDKPRWDREDRGPKKEWRPRSEEPRGETGNRPAFRSAPRQERGENRDENRFGSAPRAPFKPRGDRPQFRPAPRPERSENNFGSAPRPPFKPRGDRPAFRPAPRSDRGENRFGSAPRAPFKPRGERPQFRPVPRSEGGENRFASAPRAPFKPRGERPQFRPAPRREGGENRFGSAPRAPFKPRSERPQWKRDDAAKPRLEIERTTGPEKTASFGSGKPKPSFSSKPGFSGKPAGFGKYRGNTRGGPKRGASRPGAPRGGRKRG